MEVMWLPAESVQKQPVSRERRALFIQFEESHVFPAGRRGRKKAERSQNTHLFVHRLVISCDFQFARCPSVQLNAHIVQAALKEKIISLST